MHENNKQLLIPISAIALIATLAVVGTVSAHDFGGQQEVDQAVRDEIKAAVDEGDFERAKELREKNGIPGFHQRHHGNGSRHPLSQEAMMALENNDFAAFAAAVEGTPFASGLTEDRFATMVEIHKAHQAGNHERAQELMQSLGIMTPRKQGPRPPTNENARTAIDNNDFAAFVQAISGTPLADSITEERFATMVALHDARQSGDKERIKELRAELQP